jgi:hypothetical protein
MALTEHQKRYQQLRRDKMRKAGKCVDCQQRPAKLGTNRSGKPYTCCETCLQARRDRWQDGAMPPLILAMRKAELVH